MKHTEYNQNLVNLVTRSYDYWLGLRTFQIGFNTGLGFRYLILPKTTISLRFEYEYMNRFFGTYPADHSLNNNIFTQASVFYKLN